VVPDGFQDPHTIPFTRERDVEIGDVQLEEAGQQIEVVDVGAVGRIAVSAGARVHADAPALLDGETRQRQIVQIDEALQEIPRGIELDRQPSFREVDLHAVRTLLQTVANLRFVLAQQVINKFIARVAGNPLGRIHQAQGRR